VVIWDPASGSNNNAGYFDASLAGAGTDYPAAQATPILSPTDLACASGTTTLTSVVGGFTAAMVGNAINITAGTNLTAGLYVITARTDTNTVTLDRTPTSGGDGSSGTGYVGGRLAVFTDAFLELSVPGMQHHVWATGTMTLTENIYISAGKGTTAARVRIEGRSSTGTANPTGDNRPLIAAGAYGFVGAACDYYAIINLRVTTTGADGLRTGNYCTIIGCHVNNTSTSTGREAIYSGNYCTVIGCEAQCAYGIGISGADNNAQIRRCYVHDSGISGSSTKRGISVSSYCVVDECVVETCATGVTFANAVNYVTRCAIDGCTVGINGTAAYNVLTVENCIIANCTDAAILTEFRSSDIVRSCNLYNNTNDLTLIASEACIDADPQFDGSGSWARTAVTTADAAAMTLGVG
jgi:hypothetical protein